ncbi:MAG TPA: hypothetical protein VFV75_12880 [Candidatus Polarisedimenticolaceae bacterium]|nr:hypothetical protein [Candidatus Polarisedimenticolaceae bacterium]
MHTTDGHVPVRLLLVVTVLLGVQPLVFAAWPELGRPITTAAGDQDMPRIAGDGSGGAILTWQDGRSPIINVFAQHVRSTGDLDPAWPVDGRALLTDAPALAHALSGQAFPVIVPDGAAGAIVAWQDGRSQTTGVDIYAQHVLASGVVDPAWPANGRALCTAPGGQFRPRITTDGAGGAIVTWTDARVGVDIFAQRVLASGVVDPRWPVNGLAISIAPGDQFFPEIASDGSDGALVTWIDGRSTFGSTDIFAQHVLGQGAVDPRWPANGLGVSVAAADQLNPAIASDGEGGAIVTWEDLRDVTSHIFAQRVLSSGVLGAGWPANGRAVCTAPIGQKDPVLVPDGAHGAIVSWADLRNGGNFAQFAQHVLASGTVDAAWPVNGTALSRSNGDQLSGSLATDGTGGAIVAWEEDAFIVAQHVAASGLLDPAFPINGRLLRPVLTFQETPDLVPDGSGNAVVAWSDRAGGEGADADIYAVQVRAAATVTVCLGTPGDLPGEVDDGVRLSRMGPDAVLEWNLAANANSSDVLRGGVRSLPVGSGGAGERCLIHDTVARTLTDPDLPPPGQSFWYLVRGENLCGSGTYGFEARNGTPAAPRVSATCP